MEALKGNMQKSSKQKELFEAYKVKDTSQSILKFGKGDSFVENKLSCWQLNRKTTREALVKMIFKR